MKKIAFNYGPKMFAGFALLFLLVHLLGWSENYYLRVLNGAIHFTFIYLAIKKYRTTEPNSFDNYISGVAVGFYTSMIGVLLFTISMFLFLTVFDPAFFEELKSQVSLPQYFTPFTASLFIFVEGIVVSLIGSYLLTRIIDDREEKIRAKNQSLS